jgi:hypothetical protein
MTDNASTYVGAGKNRQAFGATEQEKLFHTPFGAPDQRAESTRSPLRSACGATVSPAVLRGQGDTWDSGSVALRAQIGGKPADSGAAKPRACRNAGSIQQHAASSAAGPFHAVSHAEGAVAEKLDLLQYCMLCRSVLLYCQAAKLRGISRSSMDYRRTRLSEAA